MRWKSFKHFLSETENFNDESKFVLGIDVGTSMTTMSLWDTVHNTPELVDMSGGYGRPSIPTVIQYIPETKEWVYGEYALLNRGFFHDITFSNLVEKLGEQEYYEIDGKNVSLVSLLARFIKELIESCKNINPNCEICGIVFATPNYMSETAKEELRRAIIMAGYEKELITFMPHRECNLRYNFLKKQPLSNEKILVLDYGNKELRGGIFIVKKTSESLMDVESYSSMFDESIGLQNLDEDIRALITKYYCQEKKLSEDQIDKQVLSQIDAFAYQNKSLVFQNGMQDKPLKLYYNFAYPPFQKTITRSIRNSIAAPYEKKMRDLILLMHEKTAGNPVTPLDINTVICTGGGFEMFWARKVVEQMYSKSKINFFKTGGGVLAMGACTGASSMLGLIPHVEYRFVDRHLIKDDYGVAVIADGRRERFFALVDRNTFWWQQSSRYLFNIMTATADPPVIKVYRKDEFGDETEIYEMELKGLPERPSIATRLSIQTEFKDINHLLLSIEDEGFGDFFPKSGYTKKIYIDVT